MARIDNKIVVHIGTEYRPCLVSGRRALFHRWVDSARSAVPRGVQDEETAERFQLWNVQAIVEYEDGTVQRVWPSEIQFIDGGEFGAYDWDAMEMASGALPWKFDEGANDREADHATK